MSDPPRNFYLCFWESGVCPAGGCQMRTHFCWRLADVTSCFWWRLPEVAKTILRENRIKTGLDH